MEKCLYHMKHYEEGLYLNLNQITSISKPQFEDLYLALGEHYVHSFPHKNSSLALQSFNEIVSIMGIIE
jgi:hypothetical protein